MKLYDVCKSYFNGFQEAFNLKENDNKTNALAMLKILSYFTVVIPLGFAAVYGAASLCGRVSKKQHLSSHENSVDVQAKKTILKNSTDKGVNVEAKKTTPFWPSTMPRPEATLTSLENLPSALKHMYDDLRIESNNRVEKYQEYAIDGLGVNVIVNMVVIRNEDLLPKGAVWCGGKTCQHIVKVMVSPSDEKVERVLASHFTSEVCTPFGAPAMSVFDEIVINDKKVV